MLIHTLFATCVVYTVAMKLGMVGVGVVGLLIGVGIGWLMGQQFWGTSSLEEALPVVVFEREGLLSARDRQLLRDRVIEPYTDYYQEGEAQLLTMTVNVPAQSGEAYDVKTIFSNGVHEGMLHGVRDGDIPYWQPNCLGECEFSEAFRAKHPEVVKAASSTDAN